MARKRSTEEILTRMVTTLKRQHELLKIRVAELESQQCSIELHEQDTDLNEEIRDAALNALNRSLPEPADATTLLKMSWLLQAHISHFSHFSLQGVLYIILSPDRPYMPSYAV